MANAINSPTHGNVLLTCFNSVETFSTQLFYFTLSTFFILKTLLLTCFFCVNVFCTAQRIDETSGSCLLPIDIGPCIAHQLRWHYDITTGTCRQFHYGGCLGNANNFNTSQECLTICSDFIRETTFATPNGKTTFDNQLITLYSLVLCVELTNCSTHQ